MQFHDLSLTKDIFLNLGLKLDYILKLSMHGMLLAINTGKLNRLFKIIFGSVQILSFISKFEEPAQSPRTPLTWPPSLFQLFHSEMANENVGTLTLRLP